MMNNIVSFIDFVSYIFFSITLIAMQVKRLKKEKDTTQKKKGSH